MGTCLASNDVEGSLTSVTLEGEVEWQCYSVASWFGVTLPVISHSSNGSVVMEWSVECCLL